MNVLLLYATRGNSTAEVAQHIANILKAADIHITLANAEVYDMTADSNTYDAFVVGTGIYTGMWNKSLLEKLRQVRHTFKGVPMWGFGMCIRVLEADGEAYAQRNYMPDFITLEFNLQEFKFFAGKFILSDINMEDRWTLAIRYDGEVPPENYNKDYRDWDAIRVWANKVASSIKTLDTN